MSVATLIVDGVEHGGWKALEVSRSLDSPASAFSFEATPRHPGRNNPVGIRAGAACQIRLDDDIVLSGFVDEVAASYSADEEIDRVAGRSKTGDLVDCAAAVATYRNQALPLIAAQLLAPYAAGVEDLTGTDDIIRRYRVEEGATVWDCLEELARRSGVLLTDSPEGNLVLTRVGFGGLPAGRLEYGRNVLSATLAVSTRERFSSYVVRGSRAGDDNDFGDVAARVLEGVTDDGLDRTRNTIVRAEQPVTRAQAKEYAVWVAATRAGMSTSYTCRVQGWRGATGGLWTPNMVVPVKDTRLGVDAELLLVDVTFSQTTEETTTTLVLRPLAGYEPVELTKQPASRKPNKGIGLWSELENI